MDYRRIVLLNFLQAKTSLIIPRQASKIGSDAFLLYGTCLFLSIQSTLLLNWPFSSNIRVIAFIH
jgi:hypothetical protein